VLHTPRLTFYFGGKYTGKYMTDSKSATSFIPEVYDNVVRQVMPFYDVIQSEIIDIVRTVKPDVKQWLDTGCGTGTMVEIALRSFPNTTFTITDPTELMLKRAIDRLKTFPEKQVRFLPPTPTEGLLAHKDALKPQVITAILCHHYYNREQRRTATKVCYQLLDASGVFISVENIMPDTSIGTQLGIERWKRFQIEHGRTSITAEKHTARFNSEYFPIKVYEHLELLKETGFQTVELFWRSHIQAGFYAIK
jgi:tRNA (cmo5U34)-methyltransferase